MVRLRADSVAIAFAIAFPAICSAYLSIPASFHSGVVQNLARCTKFLDGNGKPFTKTTRSSVLSVAMSSGMQLNLSPERAWEKAERFDFSALNDIFRSDVSVLEAGSGKPVFLADKVAGKKALVVFTRHVG